MMKFGLLTVIFLTFTIACQRPIAPSISSDAAGGDAGALIEAAGKENPLDIELLRAMSNAEALSPLVIASPKPEKVALGRLLAYDKLLSGNKDVSCMTCHSPALGTGDGLSLSVGTGAVFEGNTRRLGNRRTFATRNAPSLYNLAAVQTMFWDGRVEFREERFHTPAGDRLPEGLESALAAQVMMTVISPNEMKGEPGDTTSDGKVNEIAAIEETDEVGQWNALMGRITAIPEYRELFAEVYPEVELAELGFQHVANAIAAFETAQFRSLDSPFDRFIAGDDSALSTQQKRGGLLFYGRARCSGCHRGPLLSDFRFHNVGIPQIGKGLSDEQSLDLGRAKVTGRAEDRFLFRTPSLRNVELTGPWFHNGAYSTLRAAVEHYQDPTEALKNFDPSQLPMELASQVFIAQQLEAGILETLDPIVAPALKLTGEELDDLIAFLLSLTDSAARVPSMVAPEQVPSGLPVSYEHFGL